MEQHVSLPHYPEYCQPQCDYELIRAQAEYLRRTTFSGNRYFPLVARQIMNYLGAYDIPGEQAVHAGMIQASEGRISSAPIIATSVVVVEIPQQAQILIDQLDSTTRKDVQ
jgi:hypothetical protein